ncbi:hypothetical protein LEP1GSC198_0998 [Leptospira kirschneri str. JB]|nr:hypothetical protein LEP1GSC198_0998 [Leptospira kirschneri str. JB]
MIELTVLNFIEISNSRQNRDFAGEFYLVIPKLSKKFQDTSLLKIQLHKVY